jgi:hypothetical protein
MSLASLALHRIARVRIPLVLGTTGATYAIAMAVLIVTKAPLGSGVFFATTTAASVAYLVMLARVWRQGGSNRLLLIALGVALALRLPAALSPVGPDNDMVRYLWDGRVQRLGYNPYQVLPADPSLAHTHTPETAAMPSRRARTPYPPAAQLFFRLVVSLHDSTAMMKLALVGCDLLTGLVLWHWLVITGRNPWLVLAYAWHPLVVLEVAHSGHIDALGALWIVATAYWLSRRRTALATVAFVLAIATKLLPIVLAPLFVARIRRRDAVAGLALLALLYVPFIYGNELPLGAVPNVVAHIRFNGPLFQALAALISPQGAAAAAIGFGVAVAAWGRLRRPADDPAAWAWPMAVALACAPVIYPWYLLYLTPFLFTTATVPLTAWSFSVLPVYVVWHLSRHGGRWLVPPLVMILEYAIVAAVAVLMIWRARARSMAGSHDRSAA